MLGLSVLLAVLLACTASVDPSPWVGTWFGTIDWWTDEVGHLRTVLLEIDATDDPRVPAQASGTAWAAHDESSLACEGITGGETHHEGLVLLCELEAYDTPLLFALNGFDSDAPDHVEGQAAELADEAAAPELSVRHYEEWETLAQESCTWWSPSCTIVLDRAVDGLTRHTIESSSLVHEATVDCTQDLLYPWPTFKGKVDAAVTGALVEYALGGEVVFYVGLEPDDSGRLDWEGYPMGESSDSCEDITASLYVARGGLFEDMERIDL